MAATVHTFPGGQATPSPGAAPRIPPVIEGLAACARAHLSESLRKMFESADDVLFEMSEKARHNDEQRLYFDVMRLLRIEQPKIAQRFLDDIAGSLLAPPRQEAGSVEIDFEHLALKPTEALEESIAISNMEAKADGLFREQIWEIDRRLDGLIRAQKLALSAQCLAPAAVCAAFRHAVEPLDIAFDTKLVVYKLFDRAVIRSLGEFYAQVLAWLEANNVKAMTRAPAVEPSRWTPAAATIDRATLDALRHLGEPAPAHYPGPLSAALGQYGAPSDSAPGQYSDAALAAELASTLGGPSASDWAQAATQRLALVGRLFADILGDPNVPATLKPSLEQLRFPVIKTALSDATFFTNPQHPVRSLVHEVATMVAASRAMDNDAQREVEALVREVREQFELGAETAGAALRESAPVNRPDIEGFLSQIETQARVRREAILGKVRRIVAEEMTLRTVGREVPSTVWPLLNAGWAPLMCVRLLRYGVRSTAWNEGLSRLDETLWGLTAANDADGADWQKRRDALIEALATDLRKVGMAEAKCQTLINGLRDAYRECDRQAVAAREAAASASFEASPHGRAEDGDTAAPANDARPASPAPATPPDAPVSARELRRLLDLLCAPGAWFRVYDAERRRTRWLKVSSFHPQFDAIAFAEFDGAEALQLRLRNLVEDLRAGRSEPINPDPFAKTLLERLVRGDTAPSL